MKHQNIIEIIKDIVIISGGQSGVDRAALDVAIENNIAYRGWCPKGGWAEDKTTPPGLLTEYSELKATESSLPKERTEKNIIDSDATLIILMSNDTELAVSNGTLLTKEFAVKHHKPYLIVNLSKNNVIEEILTWIATLHKNVALNIAGPRESEFPGIYNKAKKILSGIFSTSDETFDT